MDNAQRSSHGQITGNAARVYEQFFVPALFAEWGPRVADAMALAAGNKALDVACGTGVLARELARRAGPQTVCGIDCNQGMLAVAKGLEPRIDWRIGRAQELPFEAERFDAVGSQFGLMFFEDKARALAEMWRVLAPGGRLAVAVWGSLCDTPGYASMVELLTDTFGERIANELRAPFCLGDVAQLRTLFDQAQIDNVQVQTITGRARFESIAAWVQTDVRGWTLADKLDDSQCSLLIQKAQKHLSAYVVEGRVAFESPAHIVTARKAGDGDGPV